MQSKSMKMLTFTTQSTKKGAICQIVIDNEVKNVIGKLQRV